MDTCSQTLALRKHSKIKQSKSIMSGEAVPTKRQNPSDFLKQIIGRNVVVKCNNGSDYRGVLACLDGYMNIALEQSEEYFNGEFKKRYGDAFIRGNNVLYISTQKRRQISS